jgi:hypothetical protein
VVEKWRLGGKGVRESNEVVEWAKVKHTRSGHILRYPFEHHFNTNNEKQNCKISTVFVCEEVGGEG